MGTITQGHLVAEWHDATKVCHSGYSCWIASVSDTRSSTYYSRKMTVSDALENEGEARAWAEAELRRRA